jgi:hypothetical protein
MLNGMPAELITQGSQHTRREILFITTCKAGL